MKDASDEKEDILEELVPVEDVDEIREEDR
jgi:hypothetical protein